MTIESDLAALTAEPPASLTGRVLAAVDLADEYVERPSPLGTLFVAFNVRGVCAVDLAPNAAAFEAAHATGGAGPRSPPATCPIRSPATSTPPSPGAIRGDSPWI
jgi:hypothetical protein